MHKLYQLPLDILYQIPTHDVLIFIQVVQNDPKNGTYWKKKLEEKSIKNFND